MKIILNILIITFIVIIAILPSGIKLEKITEEDKEELMTILKIEDAPSFKPILINQVETGWGDASRCYKLEFEISIEDYNRNNLLYGDKETPEMSLNWKIKKNEETYICFVREWEYNEYRKDLFDKTSELWKKYK